MYFSLLHDGPKTVQNMIRNSFLDKGLTFEEAIANTPTVAEFKDRKRWIIRSLGAGKIEMVNIADMREWAPGQLP